MSSLEGAPPYVKLVVWLLMSLGLPSAMVIAFFFVFIGYLPSPLTEVQSSMREHRAEMRGVIAYVETTQRLLRQICRNTSHEAEDRAWCNH